MASVPDRIMFLWQWFNSVTSVIAKHNWSCLRYVIQTNLVLFTSFILSFICDSRRVLYGTRTKDPVRELNFTPGRYMNVGRVYLYDAVYAMYGTWNKFAFKGNLLSASSDVSCSAQDPCSAFTVAVVTDSNHLCDWGRTAMAIVRS